MTMANIDIANLDKIFSATLDIQTLIKNCKPYSITDKEISDLVEDFEMHGREILEAAKAIDAEIHT